MIQSSADWKTTGEQIAKRWPVWTLLQDLLDHAKDLGPYKELQGEAAEIQKQRALLADHDPVQALLDKTVDLLRTSLNHHVETYRTTYDAELAALEQDSNWQSLTAEQCQAILAKHGLHETVSVVSTPSASSTSWNAARCPNGRTAPRRSRVASSRPAWRPPSCWSPRCSGWTCRAGHSPTRPTLPSGSQRPRQRIRDKLNDGPVMI